MTMPTTASNIITNIQFWSISLKALVICMVIDYITGIVVAAVFNKSKNSANGNIESRAGFKGLCRKGTILLLILVGAQLDNVIGTRFIKDVVTIGYLSNEIVSISENITLMGLDASPIIKMATKFLKKKTENSIEDNNRNMEE
ncbi:MAG: phage holin family protein [Eubacterium sp.]|nr:phage holin family protein [Eubacterium sp.]